jgi:hypothetical protein
MGHGIEKTDWQQGRSMGWHKLTDVEKELALKNSRFTTYEQIAYPTYITVNGVSVPTGEYRLVCTDNNQMIGKSFSDSFVQFPNGELLDVLEQATDGTGLVLESCGTVRNRESRFFSFSMKGAKQFSAGGRKFDAYLNVLDDITGRHKLLFLSGSTCVVCANTFAMALDGEGFNVDQSVKHTKKAKLKLDGMPKIIQAALLSHEDFAEKFNRLADQAVSTEQARGLFATLLSKKGHQISGTTFLSKNTLNTTDELVALFSNRAQGNNGENLADAFSAVTDHFTHHSAGGENVEKQFLSSEFGSGADAKQEFFALLQRPFKALNGFAKLANEAIEFSELELKRREDLRASN